LSSKYLEKLTDQLNKLPGIGRKTASRLAFHILEMPVEEAKMIAESIMEAKENIKKCEVCGNISDQEICSICDDIERDKTLVCVVEETRDIIAMEKSGMYQGVYHVLHGKLSPLSGVDADDLNIKSLIKRISEDNVKEVILALNPDLEGETTSMYLSKLLKNFGIKITKIASGIPMGGNIEYSDMATIMRAIENRREVDEG